MNILFHCWEYPPRGSGIGRYIFHMAKALRDAGHFTVIVTSCGQEGPTETQIENGVIYRTYSLADIGSAKIVEEVLEKSQQHSIDWIEGVDHLGESALLLAREKRPPMIIKAHYNDVLKIARYAQVHYGWQKFLVDIACLRERKRLTREEYSLTNADILLAPSQRMLLEMRNQKIPLPSRVGVIPNPIPPTCNWINNEADNPTLLLVGRIDIGKGIEYLPRLIRNLIKWFPNLSVEIAGGDGYARFVGSLKKWLIREMGIFQGHLKFLGELAQPALEEAYSRAWVVIIPSNWDTFPTVALEAMARGKAIVASPHGGMSEMLAETLCKISDPASEEFSENIANFLSYPDLRAEAGRAAKNRANKLYAPEAIVANYITLIRSNI